MKVLEESDKQIKQPKQYRFNGNRLIIRVTLTTNIDLIPIIEASSSEALKTLKAKWLFLLISYQYAKK